MSTYLQLRDMVHRATGVNVNTPDLVQLVKDAVNLALYDVARTNKWPELLVVNHTPNLATAATGAPIALPNDFLAEGRVRYMVVASNIQWRLANRNDLVPPPRVTGKPKAYEIVTGSGAAPNAIIIEPYTTIVPAQDRLTVDYYRTPVLLSADGDELYNNKWDSEIVTRAMEYVFTYQGKPDRAKFLLERRTVQSNPPPQS